MIATVLGMARLLFLAYSLLGDLVRRLPMAVRVRLSPRGTDAALRVEERRIAPQLIAGTICAADSRRRLGALAEAGQRSLRPRPTAGAR